jgi:hypothetical protein
LTQELGDRREPRFGLVDVGHVPRLIDDGCARVGQFRRAAFR